MFDVVGHDFHHDINEWAVILLLCSQLWQFFTQIFRASRVNMLLNSWNYTTLVSCIIVVTSDIFVFFNKKWRQKDVELIGHRHRVNVCSTSEQLRHDYTDTMITQDIRVHFYQNLKPLWLSVKRYRIEAIFYAL